MTAPMTIPVGEDETDSRSGAGRWGMTSIKPDGDYTLVYATARHVYVEPKRNVRERVMPGQMYWMETHRVRGNTIAGLVHPAPEREFHWWDAPLRLLGAEDLDDAICRVTTPTEGALRIASGVGYDPGSAAFRLHTAINEHTKHASAFVRWGDSNPHCSLRQYDAQANAYETRDAVLQADVLHNHVAYFLMNNTGVRPRPDQVIVRHYHGSSTSGRSHIEPAFDRVRHAVTFAARLQLAEEGHSLGATMHWSPIPMPIARYRTLRDRARSNAAWVPLEGAATMRRPLRIAHTPTNMRLKGTDEFRRAIHALQKRGVPVESDLIHGVSLREALERQAACDVTFDSFWLGIQGSGLQAASMEMPVIAGDVENRAIYERRIGYCPYTFANDLDTLEAQIERIAMDPTYREIEAQRVAEYARHYHDYAVVARMYEATLSSVLQRPTIRTDTTPLPLLRD